VVEQGFLVGAAVHAASCVLPGCTCLHACPGHSGVRAGGCGAFVCAFAMGPQP